jgi:hypothetical protein
LYQLEVRNAAMPSIATFSVRIASRTSGVRSRAIRSAKGRAATCW